MIYSIEDSAKNFPPRDEDEDEEVDAGPSNLFYVQDIKSVTEIYEIKHNEQEAIEEAKRAMRCTGTMFGYDYQVWDYDKKEVVYTTKDDNEFGDQDLIFEVFEEHKGKAIGKCHYSGPHLHKAHKICHELFHKDCVGSIIKVKGRED